MNKNSKVVRKFRKYCEEEGFESKRVNQKIEKEEEKDEEEEAPQVISTKKHKKRKSVRERDYERRVVEEKEREEMIEEKRRERRRRTKYLTKKTRSGQTNLNHQMVHLLSKLTKTQQPS